MVTERPLSELLRRAHQEIVATFLLEDRTGLTVERVNLLRELLAGGPKRQIDLGRRCSIDRSSLSSMVLSMTRDGLISAVRHEKLDLRIKVLTITPKGLAALRQADTALCAAEEAVLSRVDDPSQARVQRILRKMAGVA